MKEDDELPSLEALGQKVAAARKPKVKEETPGTSPRAMMGQALRLGIDQVAALLVGFGIGYVLDMFLGTKPWMIIVFVIFGAAAGVLNVWRASMRMGSGDPSGQSEESAGKTPNKE